LGRARRRGSPEPAGLRSAPLPARGACGRAAPPSALSAASRRPHSLPHPGREREPLPPSRAGGPRSAPELDFTFTPRASRPRGSALTGPAHPSGARVPASLHAPYASLGPLGEAPPGRAPPTGPLGAQPQPELPDPPGRRLGRPRSLPADPHGARPAVSGLTPLGAEARPRAPPGPSPNPPSSGGPPATAGRVGWADPGKKIFVCWAGQAPSWAVRPLALRRWRAPR